MATVALTSENFNQQVEKNGILIIDWWAPWCGPCRSFAPVYEKASENAKYGDVTFGKVNTEDQPELAGTFQIQAIPTLMVFRDQVLVFARPGMVPAAALDDLLDQVKALDMDDVRKRIAEQETEEHGQEQEQEQEGEGDGDARGAGAAEGASGDGGGGAPPSDR